MPNSMLPGKIAPTRRARVFPWAIILSATLLPLFGLGSGLSHQSSSHSHKPRFTEVEIEKQAIAICSGFSNQVAVMDTPSFRDEYLGVMHGGSHHRYLWIVSCSADGKHYQVMINDLTGKLTCLIADDRAQISQLEARTSSSEIRTSDQAVSISVERLKELKFVSPGTKIRLVRQPERAEDGRTWEVVWQIRHPEQKHGTRVKLLLDGHVGAPVIAVDHYELEKYTLN